MGNKVMMSSEDAFRLIVKSIDMGKYDNVLEILNDIGEQLREAEERIQEAEEQLREAEVIVREYGNLMLDLYEDSCSTEEIQERITQLADRTTTFLTPATYTPKTEMGKKMMALRERAIAGGMTLLDEDEIAGVICKPAESGRMDICPTCGAGVCWSNTAALPDMVLVRRKDLESIFAADKWTGPTSPIDPLWWMSGSSWQKLLETTNPLSNNKCKCKTKIGR